MNGTDSRMLRLALKKQRLQIASDDLRARFGDNARGLAPVFGAVDTARDGVAWIRQRPEIPVAVLVVLLVARPRVVWRWSRRAFVAWQTWRRTRRYIESALPASQGN